jgi:hypothetical protein
MMAEVYINQGCGCLEKQIVVLTLDATIHLESNGNGEMFIDCGDWEDEITFPNCSDIVDLEKRAIDYINKIRGE